jgi:hypothetical protein
MAQLGHTHPSLALSIQARSMRLDQGKPERLTAISRKRQKPA